MKKIHNWQRATVADIETDGLLRELTKCHVLSFKLHDKEVSSIQGSNHERLKAFLNYHIENQIPVVGHYFILFDVPALEKILDIDLSELIIVDTLILSWYLMPDRNNYGLEGFGEDYGIKKPEVVDWENLSYEEYKFRCESDIHINTALWEDLKGRLVEMYTLSKEQVDSGSVGGKRVSPEEIIHLDSKVGLSVDQWIDEILTFLMFKMDVVRLQESTGWHVDEELLDNSIEGLTKEFNESKATLESVMPAIPKYSDRKKPAKPYSKKTGGLSSAGEKWEVLTRKLNNKEVGENGSRLVVENKKEGFLSELVGHNPANANSPAQVKDFLYGHGWKPINFKFDRDEEAIDDWVKIKPKKGAKSHEWDAWKANKPKDREIPQITVNGDEGKELCPSLEELAERVPQIAVYAKYSVLKHRIGLLKGFKRDMYQGKLEASIAGLANTMRVKHRTVVNLPSVNKPYGKIIRGVFTCPDGYTLCGSDLSSLEDRLKHNFMIPHDPEYVKQLQTEGYDQHLANALAAGFITQEELDDYKKGIKPEHVVKARATGKTITYASVYQAGPATLARSGGMTLEEATAAHKGYWELNWSVNAIAEEQVVIKDSRGQKWLINPINGFCYSLRQEKDRFSTLIQGTGAYVFDLWCAEILKRQMKDFNKKTMTYQAHDENVFSFKDSEKSREWLTRNIKESIEQVNEALMFRRKMGIETQYGKRYSEIH